MYRDLSHPIESGMTTFPGDPPVSVEPAATVETDGYRVSVIRCGSHTGTHIDAPSHVGFDDSLDAFDLDRFVFEATVVDCTAFGAREAIGPSVVPVDCVDDCDMVVFRTGWDDHWGSPRYFDHPYLSADCVERCVNGGCSVGLDTLNPDPTPSGSHDGGGVTAHRALLGNGLFIVENLRNLDGLDRCRLFAVPLSLPNGDGSPVRAFARGA